MSVRFFKTKTTSASMLVLLGLLAAQAAFGKNTNPFPESVPERVGIPAAALRQLAGEVQTLVDNQEIVGGELVVIKNRKTVLRQAFGWKDKEAGQPMEIDAIYCVRSMTKPFVGTAVQMLIDDGKLALDTPVHSILPSFAGPGTSEITIEHLLTHTSGFPFTTLSRPLVDYTNLSEVAADAAATKLLFEPGERFEYSDAGSDTLGAIVAQISGMPAEQFIQERILDPLGMKDTLTLLRENEQVNQRIPSAYSGGTGSWSRHWRPVDPPIFPLFLASQSLYSTTTDYARFLAWWMDGGRTGEQKLLSEEAVSRALKPNLLMEGYPATFEGADAYYGQQWIVYAKKTESGSAALVSFGHSGSDGTYAWAWPEQDLIVLFFTQSRGTLAGVGLEQSIQALLVDQQLKGQVADVVDGKRSGLQQLAGLYWDEDVEHAYYVITPLGENLQLDRPGGKHMVFKPTDKTDRFTAEVRPQTWIEFVRSESGEVTAMRTFFSKRVETDPRHEPAKGLPSVAEVIEQVRQAHQIDRLSELGTVKLTASMEFVDRKMKGSAASLFNATSSRTEVNFGSVQEVVIVNGDDVWSETSINRGQLQGRLKQQAILDQLRILFGDWTRYYEQVEVLKRIEVQGRSLLMVRVVPKEGAGATMFVDEHTGLLFRKDDLVQVPGLGIIGVQTLYEDYQDVGGMKLPFRTTSKLQNRLIGRIVSTVEQAETGLKAASGTFSSAVGGGQ